MLDVCTVFSKTLDHLTLYSRVYTNQEETIYSKANVSFFATAKAVKRIISVQSERFMAIGVLNNSFHFLNLKIFRKTHSKETN